MESFFEFIDAKVTLAIDGWLRKHGGWFFDQHELGYEDARVRELESMPWDDSPPIANEVDPILLEILACESLSDYHHAVCLAMAAIAPM